MVCGGGYGGNRVQAASEDPDLYSILQVPPDCDAKHLEVSYKALAKQYHPDHSSTADIAKFKEVTAAYRVLRDPQRREEYDQAHPHLRAQAATATAARVVGGIDQATVANDALVHETILMHLYNLRRQNIESPGAGEWQLLDMLGCSQQNLQFHTWYLKEKGYIAITEEGTWSITLAGVEHTLETTRTRQEAAPLLLQMRRGAAEEPDPLDDAAL